MEVKKGDRRKEDTSSRQRTVVQPYRENERSKLTAAKWSEFVTPPSTRSILRSVPESARMASRIARVWRAKRERKGKGREESVSINQRTRTCERFDRRLRGGIRPLRSGRRGRESGRREGWEEGRVSSRFDELTWNEAASNVALQT